MNQISIQKNKVTYDTETETFMVSRNEVWVATQYKLLN